MTFTVTFGRYCLRIADEDREVTPAELKQFFIANEYKEKWEKTRTDIFSKQIDKQAIKNFCSRAISVGRMADGKYNAPTILKRFGLVDGDYLTNAGNVLFGSEHPVTLKAAIFATDEKLAFLNMQLLVDIIISRIGGKATVSIDRIYVSKKKGGFKNEHSGQNFKSKKEQRNFAGRTGR